MNDEEKLSSCFTYCAMINEAITDLSVSWTFTSAKCVGCWYWSEHECFHLFMSTFDKASKLWSSDQRSRACNQRVVRSVVVVKLLGSGGKFVTTHWMKPVWGGGSGARARANSTRRQFVLQKPNHFISQSSPSTHLTETKSLYQSIITVESTCRRSLYQSFITVEPP